MRKLLIIILGMTLLAAACAGEGGDTESGAQADPTSTADAAAATETAEPTAVEIPTTAAPTETAEPTTTSTPQPTATTQPTATPQPSATTQPTATTVPATPQPSATTQPTATTVPATPKPTATTPPQPTATSIPPTPTPTVYVNPDCYVGPGAADEPVWWCGGKICVVGQPHYGCPTGPPHRPTVRIDCSISDTDIEVNEVVTLRAIQNPTNVAVQFAFSHGDGTIDNTAESRAFYRAPGTYEVRLLWQYHGAKGSTPCGTVTVRPIGGAKPTPTPTSTALQIGCSISPQRTVKVGEVLTYTAFSNPADVMVEFTFDHGDGTLDPREVSYAYYNTPGWYQVELRWTTPNRSGTTYCGTVTVEPDIDEADYVGHTRAAAEARASAAGFTSRITRIDGEWLAVTMDYSLSRLNFELESGIVTKVTIG